MSNVLFALLAMLSIMWFWNGLKPTVNETPKPEPQPVYLMFTCPKVGGQYVYELTEDMKLKELGDAPD